MGLINGILVVTVAISEACVRITTKGGDCRKFILRFMQYYKRDKYEGVIDRILIEGT